MTNVDFFRLFAEDNNYYLEHSRQSLDYSNLFDADSATDEQYKLFHLTRNFENITNESGAFAGVRYKGEVLCLVKSDLDGVIDVQRGGAEANGKYTKHVKPMIDDGGVVKLLTEFNNCNYDYELSTSDCREVYNFLDTNMDGIRFTYELVIE